MASGRGQTLEDSKLDPVFVEAVRQGGFCKKSCWSVDPSLLGQGCGFVEHCEGRLHHGDGRGHICTLWPLHQSADLAVGFSLGGVLPLRVALSKEFKLEG